MSSYSWVLLVLVSFAAASSSSSSIHDPDADVHHERRSRIRRVTQEVIVTEGNDGDDTSPSMANNIFGDGDDSSTSTSSSLSSSMANNLFEWNMNHMMLFNGTNHTSRFHIGCEQLLKTNHDPEPLAPINVGGMSMSVVNAGGEGNNEDENDVEMTTTSDVTVSSGVVATAKNCINNFADTGTGTKYACSNINLMSFLNLATFASPNKCNGAIPTASDAWGWMDNGREFALVGLSNGAGFVEITDPLNPVYIGILLSHTGCSMWRNIKTYGNYAFVVSEASGHGLQVFDLRLLLTADPTKMPIEFPETAHYSKFGNSHTMDIDVVAGFAYAMGTNTYSAGLHIVNIQNPTSPTLAGGYSGDGYTHDGQCLTYQGPDTRYTNSQICFCYNEDSLTIVDVTNKSNPTKLSRLTYANSGYTHQGWLTDDGKHVVVNDETDTQTYTRTHVFNVQSLTNPVYVGYHSGTTLASDHNLYIKGNLVFESNYRAGLQVLRIDNLATPKLTQVAHFDIYTSSNSGGYNGSWSNYPYFHSGTVIVSGIEQGLYVLQSANNFGLDTSAPSTSAPSSAPTNSPTSNPTTSKPTKSPTFKPSFKPTTPKPTKAPPTRKPTRRPTAATTTKRQVWEVRNSF